MTSLKARTKHIDLAYETVLKRVLDEGEDRPNRTGVGSLAIPAAMFQYDLACGPPILHGKKMPFKSIITELSGFLNGITSKKWFQDRGCKVWDEWCNPQIVSYSNNDPEQKKLMKACDDLGPIYGAQWRRFMGHSQLVPGHPGPEVSGMITGFDQLAKLVEILGKDPDSRRMIVSAVNPIEQPMMALPPCHFAWQVLVINGKLNLSWHQRSCDMFLGVPFNIASYGFLALLLCHQFGFIPGMLTGHLGDTHIYDNHREQVDEQLSRDIKENKAKFDIADEFESVLAFYPEMVRLDDYDPHPAIKGDIAV